MVCLEVGLAIGSIIFIVYIFVQHKFSYWKRRNVRHSPPSFPLGNCQGISRTRNLAQIMESEYNKFPGERFVGIYIIFGPGLLIRDPELVKNVLTKDFSNFSGRGFKVNPERDPLTGHLFFVDGNEWRNLRTKMTPTFTSGKMKMMFPIIEACSQEMKEYLSTKDILEVGDVFTRYATNVVTRCAYGIDVDFFKDPDPTLRKMIHRVGNPTFKDAITRGLAFSIAQFTRSLPFRLVPKDLSDYFVNLIQQTMEHREKNNVQRNDFLQTLIDLKNKGYLEDPDFKKEAEKSNNTPFTMYQAAAQAFSFLIGGFDTSAVTMQCCLYELALHPEVQTKVREEVTNILEGHEGALTYESLQELTYLEQVINETQRLHPIAPFLSRECTKAYKIPETDLLLEEGTKIWISTSGLQKDPQYFESPEEFKPERFAPENKSKINPYTFIPFGEGPRSCIGTRFAMMQMKTGLATFLANFSVKTCAETPLPPLQVDPKKSLTSIKDGVTLKVVPL